MGNLFDSGSLVTLLSHRHTLRSGKHLSTPASSSQIVGQLDGQSCTSIGHLLLPGRENVSEIQHATGPTFRLPFHFSTHTPYSQRTPTHTSKPSRRASFHRPPLETISDTCSLCFLYLSHSSSEVLPLSAARSVFAWPFL